MDVQKAAERASIPHSGRLDDCPSRQRSASISLQPPIFAHIFRTEDDSCALHQRAKSFVVDRSRATGTHTLDSLCDELARRSVAQLERDQTKWNRTLIDVGEASQPLGFTEFRTKGKTDITKEVHDTLPDIAPPVKTCDESQIHLAWPALRFPHSDRGIEQCLELARKQKQPIFGSTGDGSNYLTILVSDVCRGPSGLQLRPVRLYLMNGSET